MVEILLKLVCKCNDSISRAYWELEKITLDFIWITQYAEVAKILRKKNSTSPGMNIHYK